MAVHRHARAFGGVADAYERGRPAFPRRVVDHLVQQLDLRPGRRVLDLAAGTGKLTRALVASGADIIAIEPSAGMRTVFARMVPDVPVLDGTAEAIPLEDDTIDAATVAQAFHWFDADAALHELDRVLRPRGRVALVWNTRDAHDPLESAVTELIDHHRDGAPSHRNLDLDGVLAESVFQRVDHLELPWSQTVGENEFVDRFLSVSFVASLDDDATARAEADLRELFRTHAVHGRAAHAYLAEVHVLDRAGT